MSGVGRIAIAVVCAAVAGAGARANAPVTPSGGEREKGTPTSTPTPTPTPNATSTPTPNATSTPNATPTDLPAPLPPPEHPPEEVQQPALREPDDALDLLWSHRLNFAAGGAPLVTVRLMEGQGEIAFRTRGPARLVARGGPRIELPAGALVRVRARGALPAALAHFPLLGDAPWTDRPRVEAIRRLWEQRGVRVLQRVTGALYGIAGHVIDSRRIVLLADGDGSDGFARQFAEEALALYGGRTAVFSEIVRRPSGALEVRGATGAPMAEADALVSLEVEGDAGFTVERVEHDVGYAAHGFDDRAYRGRLHVTLDASGRLAAVLAVPLEELLRGLVPSEIPASVPREALRAQAVTARSNVLAQIGTRHLTDPYVVCSEVHCQAYKGDVAQTAATDAAVRDTAGEALFGRADRALVDAVYSAICGGHGEDNDAVWPTAPNRNLRGRPDLPPQVSRRWSGGLQSEPRLRAFLAAAPRAFCSRKERYRWERRFGPGQLAGVAAVLDVGRITGLDVKRRGVSGRARVLAITGERGVAVVEGELRIRRLLGNLPSAMFVVERAGTGFVLRGGGWGHGSGMCQWGAVGRADAGQSYREILRAYYSGAEVAKIY